MKGIDKRIHKDGTVSYRARVHIKGHPVLIQSFAFKTLAMKWKRDTESAIERGAFSYEKPGSKHTLSQLSIVISKKFYLRSRRTPAMYANISSGGGKN